MVWLGGPVPFSQCVHQTKLKWFGGETECGENVNRNSKSKQTRNMHNAEVACLFKYAKCWHTYTERMAVVVVDALYSHFERYLFTISAMYAQHWTTFKMWI